MRSNFPIRMEFVLAAIGLATVVPARAALDVVSGASQGRTMVTVSAITTTANTAAIKYSEGYRNGDFRFYYTTTAFASSSDTTRSTVTKLTVTTRGSGTLNLSNLAANTKYYFRFQGYYPKGTANYWATGSFTTAAASGIAASKAQGARSGAETVDALGRPSAGAAGIGFHPEGAAVAPRDERR